jgi:exonuclease VII large subunit
LAGANRQLYALSPHSTLERGYAIIEKQNVLVTSPSQLTSDDLIHVRVRAGEFKARVE